MKKIGIIACVLFALGSCEVIELDSPNNGTTTDDNARIASIAIEANDLIEATAMIAGSSEKMWKAEDFTLSGSDNLTACRLDDQMTFNTNGTYIYDSGVDMCGAEDNQRMRSGSWKIVFDRKVMVFDEGTNDEYEAEIIGLKDGELRLKGNYFNLEVRGQYKVS